MKNILRTVLTPVLICVVGASASCEVPTLRELADQKGFEVGVLLSPNCPFLKQIEQREFNLGIVTFGWPENVRPDGTIDWSWPDRQLAEAKEAGMRIRFQHLIFSNYYPDWLEDKTSSRTEFEAFMKNVIVQAMTRYKGDIQEWVVVNEPQNPPVITNDIFYRVYGGYDYIDVAFQTARETDPDAILIYNHFENESSHGRMTRLSRDIVARLKAKNLIDGVGLQMHIRAPYPVTKQDMIDTMRGYGIPVYVTEFDVDLRNIKGTREERFAMQAQITKNVIEACLESGVCRSFSTWGIGDKYSWLESPRFYGSLDADPTFFDDDLDPKPAYFSILAALEGMRMEIDTVFTLIFFALLGGFIVIRAVFIVLSRRAGLNACCEDHGPVKKETRKRLNLVPLFILFVIASFSTLFVLDLPALAWMKLLQPELMRVVYTGVGFAALLWQIRIYWTLHRFRSVARRAGKDHVFITAGPYRRIRHPLYVALFLFFAGLALVSAFWPFMILVSLLVPLFIHTAVREEKTMIRRFGDEYRVYMKQTGRFLPRIRTSKPDA